MQIAFGILVTLLQLGVFVGLIVLVVKLVSKKGSTSTEGTGVSIRRFFQYLIMLVMLAIAAFGVIGIVDAALSTGSAATRDTTAIARSIAFLVVGLPVYGGLALFTRRQLSKSPAEGQSFGLHAYLTVALIGSLVSAVSFAIAFIGELLAEGDLDGTALISMIVWGCVWAAHWRFADRRAESEKMQLHLLAGSLVGLVPLTIGAGIAIGAALGEAYDAVVSITAVDAGIETLVRGLVLFVVGALVWGFYWLGRARTAPRSMLWLTYVLLIGVLGGVVTTTVGAGTLIYLILNWAFGGVGSTSAAIHFASIPGAVATLIVGAGAWSYHRWMVGHRSDTARTEVDRVYDYLLSAAGLVVAAGGLATAITVVLDALGSEAVIDSRGSAGAVAITLLLVGLPVWWRHWSRIRRLRAAVPDVEVASPTRRIYLYLLFGAMSLVAIISLIVLIFLLVEDLLDGKLGSGTIDDTAVAFSLIVTSGAIAWYHFAVFREDRSIAPAAEAPILREIVFVGGDADAAAISAAVEARVTRLRAVGDPVDSATFDDLVETLAMTGHERVVVIAEGGGFAVIPLDR